MKKLLALVLALVMTLSLCVVSSNAAFDGEKIDYKEAVEVMAKLGILVGDENGKFNPDATLTREQAAKIICCMLLGVKTANKLSVDKAPFADVAADRWSAPFIAYCAANGIVDGLGDGSFDPAGTLTGHAFGKMLLTALEVEGTFTGASWAINVAAALVEEKLDKNVEDVVLSQNLTREQAAQFALNGLKWNGGETTYGVYDEDNDTTYTFDNRTDALLFYSMDKERRTYIPEYEDTEDSLIDEVFGVLVDTGVDSFGRVATVYSHKDWDDLKFGEKADYVLVAQKNQTLAQLLKDNNLDKKLTTLDGSETITGSVKAGEVVELFTEKKDIEKVVSYFYAYAKVTDLEKVDAESSDLDEDRADAGISKVYDITTATEVEETDYLFVDKLTDNEYSEEDVEIVELGDLAKKDTVALTLQEESEDVYVVRGVADLTFVDGVKTAYGTNYIKVDGTKYVVSGKVTVAVAGNYADTWTYALDPNGIVVHGEEKEAADADLNYAWVNKTDATDEATDLLGTSKNAAVVQLVGLDGEKTTYNYNLKKAPKDATAESGTYVDDEDNGVELEKGDLYFEYKGVKYAFTEDIFEAVVKTNEWVSFTEADGAVTLKAADADADAADVVTVTVKEDEKVLVADELYATSSTTVTVLKAGKVVNSYKGYANFPKTALNKSALVLFASNDTYAKSVYIFDGTATTDKETIDVALYVSTGDTTEDGVVATFYIDGQKVSYTVAAADVADAKAGQLFAAEVDEDGELTLGDPVGEQDVITDTDGEYVIFETDGALDLDEDCAVYKVSKDGKTVTTMSVEDLEEEQAVMYILNGDEDAVAYIFVYKDITILAEV